MAHLIEDGRTVATVNAYLAAIAMQHRLCGHVVNRAALADTAKGIRRLHGAPQREARPLLGGDLRDILGRLDPNRPGDVRDGAILVLGWAGALRQSEIVGLDWRRKGSGSGCIRNTEKGLVVTLARSKASQEKPVDVIVPAEDMPAAVEWLQRWAKLARLEDRGPVFRPVDRMGRVGERRLSAKTIAKIIKARLRAHTLATGGSHDDAEETAQAVSGHSLRAGFCTTSALAKVPEWQIRSRSRHSSPAMVAKYVRAAESWNDNALKGIGF
jgi:integrase